MKFVLSSAYIGGMHQLPNRYSREALYEAFSETPQAYTIDSECGGILSGMHRAGSYLNGLTDDLCEIYDCPEYLQKRNSKKASKQINQFEIHDVFVNSFWATTPSTFEENTIPNDLEGGLLSRFLIYKPTVSPEYVPVCRSDASKNDECRALSDQLRGISSAIRHFNELSLSLSDKCLTEYNSWQKTLYESISQNTTEGTLSARMRVYVFKLAMLYYCGSPDFIAAANEAYKAVEANRGNMSFVGMGDKSEAGYAEMQIPDKYFDEALQQVKGYYYPTAAASLLEAVENGNKTTINQIIKALEKAPGRQLTRSELLQKVKVTSKELTELLLVLVDEERVCEGVDTSTDKRNRPKNTQYFKLSENGGSK